MHNEKCRELRFLSTVQNPSHELRHAAYGVWSSGRTDYGNCMGLVPHDQTIQRAEAIAVLVAIARSWDPIYIGSDSRFAVNYCRLLIKDPDIDVSNWAHPDIWMCIQTVLHEVGTDWVGLKWIKGHALNDECLASGVATLEDAFGNDQADKLAAKGALQQDS